ncbi:MAG: hypothetical protein E7201_00350 [Selenomonas ruminantium]|uniref:Uncharacterized protein n=1 Tax=Selenomonas ruminantium TaxID=971 RepID=A0A927WKN2_SELRU|nr:hypothetical protein [Selenomonas ruminantium]
MKTYCVENLHEYMQSDWILDLLEREREDAEMDIRTNSWLFSMENKRMIYSDMYGDILRGENNFKNILDIGGIQFINKKMARNSQYELLDSLLCFLQNK